MLNCSHCKRLKLRDILTAEISTCHFSPFRWLVDTCDYGKRYQTYDFLFVFNSSLTIALSRFVFEIFTTKIFRCQGRFGHFWWPNGYADQWVRLPAWGFLLVFYSRPDHSPKMHRFELGHGTDGRRTDRSIA